MNTQANTISSFQTTHFSAASIRVRAAGFVFALVATVAMLQGANGLASHTDADQSALMSRAMVTSSQA